MDDSKYFISIVFLLEKKFKTIAINFLSEYENFISVSYKEKKSSFWILETLFQKNLNLREFIFKFNSIRKSLNYSELTKTKTKTKTKLSLGEYFVKRIKNENWLLKNKLNLKPIIIDNFFIFDDNLYEFNKRPFTPIKINASYAFGSGYHETTKNCILATSYLVKRKRINNFLDYGTGSGILGICFQKINKYGKSKYIDLDKKSLELTKINIKKNNLKYLNNIIHTRFHQYKYYKKAYYDLLAANILYKPLKGLIKKFNYLLKKNSYLIISGILETQKNYIVNKYRFFNFYICKIYSFNNWVTIIFKKK